MLKLIKRWTGRLLLFLLLIIIAGLLIPDHIQMPVAGATDRDFNHNSFWYYPWGKSITHKGVDIFAKRHTAIKSANKGIVVFTGVNDLGGNFVVILGAKWRFHYYAHLEEVRVTRFSMVDQNTVIGTVGDSGNARGKPTHLHYTIATFIPQSLRPDNSPQRFKKLFYINPIPYIRE